MGSKDQENFLVGALVGGAFGAAAALLLTPYPGAEIRKKMRKSWDHMNGNHTKAPAHAQGSSYKTVKKRQPAKRKAAAAKHSSKSHSPAHKN